MTDLRGDERLRLVAIPAQGNGWIDVHSPNNRDDLRSEGNGEQDSGDRANVAGSVAVTAYSDCRRNRAAPAAATTPIARMRTSALALAIRGRLT
jgi:hypothetical protein